MSTTKNRSVQPYLFFNGRCEQAVEFYREVLGAKVEMMMRFKDSPEPPPPGVIPPGFENKIMHTSFRIGETTVMASDGCSAGKATFEGFCLSLSVARKQKPIAYSRRWLTVARSGCRWPRLFGRPASAC